jgi:hypothetical protein
LKAEGRKRERVTQRGKGKEKASISSCNTVVSPERPLRGEGIQNKDLNIY